jgi:hypothetical protein
MKKPQHQKGGEPVAVLRLASGNDVVVKLSSQEVVAALANAKQDFVELPGEDVPVLVRPASVMAIIEDSRRGTTGFRLAAAESGGG